MSEYWDWSAYTDAEHKGMSPYREVGKVEDIADVERAFTGTAVNFRTEKAYTDWLLQNENILRQVLGITGEGRPKVNQPLFSGTGYRPDIVYNCTEQQVIIEVKNAKNTSTHSIAVGNQIQATAELEYYGMLCSNPVLVLVAPIITHEIIRFINHYRKKIWLIEANPESFTVIPATDG